MEFIRNRAQLIARKDGFLESQVPNHSKMFTPATLEFSYSGLIFGIWEEMQDLIGDLNLATFRLTMLA